MSSIISERLKEIDDYEVQEYIGSDSFRAIDKESKKEVVIQFFITQVNKILPLKI